jgi:hypothetical protein
MTYFTFRFRNDAGEIVHESDFTLEEFIPLVRQTLRSLAQEPEIVANPTGYRVFIRPCYDAVPHPQPSELSRDVELSPSPPAVEEGSLLQISEEDVEVYAPVSYVDEIEAFYNPGTSMLCVACPDRLRCPGSALTTHGQLGGWIELDPDSVRTNERVTYFVLRVEAAGRVLHTGHIRIGKLKYYANLALTLLRHAGRSTLKGSERAEIVARFEGQPQIDPSLLPARRPQVAFRIPAAPAAARPEPPRRLVDWDGLEESEVRAQSALPADPLPADAADLEITVFPTETDPLPRRSPPAAEPITRAGINPDHLQIFLHRSVIRDLNAQRRDLRSEMGGILVGEAVLDPADGRPYVEVVAALQATDSNGEQMRVNLDSNFLRQVHERIEKEFPGRRTVGWYQFHLMRVAVSTAGSMVTAGIVGEPLRLMEDEVFLHRNFFPQQWHLGLVIDASKGILRFYHLQDGEMAVSNSCRLVS